MTIAESNLICKQAQAYYYEYLQGQRQEHIPAEIAAHIDKCRFCQGKLDLLKTLVAGIERYIAENPEQADSAAVSKLGAHFGYIGALVSCRTAKPFLPGLAGAGLEANVPTPITVHLDKCYKCANDLKTIRQLNLTPEQLHRLGQLLSEAPAVDTDVCVKARNALEPVGEIIFESVAAEVLRHFCICPACRKLLYNARQKRLKKLGASLEQQAIPCEAISDADIFDYVVPYGIDPSDDRYAMFRQSLVSHLISCPKCMSKMQELHKTIYGIVERQESEVVTCFKLEEGRENPVVGCVEDMYKDWPIVVEVFNKSELASTAPDDKPRGRVKRKVPTRKCKRFIRPLAAAAIILIVACLVFMGPAAKAVDLGRIYGALERIKNVHFAAFIPEKTKPTQQVWISRSLNIKMSKTNSQWVLWDIKNELKKAKNLDTNLTEASKLNYGILIQVKGTMETPWGLLPFGNTSAVPKNAEWQQVADEEIETFIANTEVYDLIWMEETVNGSAVYHKWRGYIDVETKLPMRIEWWQKYAEEEYKLASIMKVSYPTDIEIQAVIDEAGFR